jgi:hypothetical protein
MVLQPLPAAAGAIGLPTKTAASRKGCVAQRKPSHKRKGRKR